MFGKPDPQQQWSVHAEFTISHPRSDPDNLPQAHTEQADNGVRMTYTWTSSSQAASAWSAPPSTSSEGAPKYGFQKGNLLFTSTPPRRVHDSGYGSDLLSPNSYQRRPVQPYNRKCRSTCNIVLSTNIDENRTEETDSVHTQCGRTQSLRCQTPTLRCDRKDNFYGCGDPWCHHYEDFSGRFSPVMETCEDCPSGQASTKECDNRRDACVQTFEMIDKCTSPIVKMGRVKYAEYEDRKEKREKKKYGSGSRRRTEPIFQRSQSPSSITPDSLEGTKVRFVFKNKTGNKERGQAKSVLWEFTWRREFI